MDKCGLLHLKKLFLFIRGPSSKTVLLKKALGFFQKVFLGFESGWLDVEFSVFVPQLIEGFVEVQRFLF